jgi:hypothetical protein
MPTERKKGSRVREPISEAEWRTVSFYYNDAQRQEILSTFERNPDADDRSLLDRLEIAAGFFVNKARSEREEPHRPHEANRHRDSIILKAKDLVDAIEKLAMPAREDILLAATQLARANHQFSEIIQSNVISYDDVIPGAKAQTRELNIDQWITRIKTDLEWLVACLEHANRRNFVPIVAEPDALGRQRLSTDPSGLEFPTWHLPRAGNRADGPLLDFIEAIVFTYADHAKRPVKPRYNKTRKTEIEPKGELLDLIHACLSFLRITKSKAAVFKTLERLLGSGPRFGNIFEKP